MPDEDVTVKAIFIADNPGGGGGGNSGGNGAGNTGGSSSPGNGSTAPNTPETQPNQPIVAEVSIIVDDMDKYTSDVAIPEKAISEAIGQAIGQSNTQGDGETGITVVVNMEIPEGATDLSIILSQTALQSLVEANVSSLQINGLPVSISFDQAALQAIQTQTSGNVSITATDIDGLSKEAQDVIGGRPVYNITLSNTTQGGGASVSSFGGGTVTISIPYTPAPDEFTDYLHGVYVDEEGNVTRIDSSYYDEESGCLILTTNHLSIYGVGYTAPSAQFTDITNHWALKFIDYVVGMELLSGTTETTFSPDTPITREIMVMALGKLTGVDIESYSTVTFSDVSTDSIYAPYNEWAYQLGIVKGVGNNRFEPHRSITREEIAIIFDRYARAMGLELPTIQQAAPYIDQALIGDIYKDAVKVMQQAGIMTGGPGNRFNPKGSATRAEFSTMLYRYIKLTTDPKTPMAASRPMQAGISTIKMVSPLRARRPLTV